MADDVGLGDLSHAGGKVPTPNLDRLAREGMRFTDAHTPAAICAPSRFSLITGSNPQRSYRGGAWAGPGDALRAGRAQGVHTTLGDVAQAAAYRTAFVGKLHLGTPKLHRHGFDHAFALPNGIQGPPHHFVNGDFRFVGIDERSRRRKLEAGETEFPDGTRSKLAGGLGDSAWDSRRVGDLLASDAEAFVSEHRAQHPGRPFLLYYSSQAVHAPHTPPLSFPTGRDDDGDGVPDEARVAGASASSASDMLFELDLQVGRILAALDRAGIARDTIVVFTSDNGTTLDDEETPPGHDASGGLRGAKSSIYEGGHRVPLIVRWGDGTPTGSRIVPGGASGALVSVNDLMASLYDLTGQAVPPDQAMDSVSLLPLLMGRADAVRDSLYLQGRLEDRDADGEPRWALAWRQDDADGEWLLIAETTPEYAMLLKERELYDLASDPRQTRNLIGDPAHATRVETMLASLRKSWKPGSTRTTPAVDYTQPGQRTPIPTRAGSRAEAKAHSGPLQPARGESRR